MLCTGIIIICSLLQLAMSFHSTKTNKLHRTVTMHISIRRSCINNKCDEERATVAQKGHVHYQFQHFQLPILNFLITNFLYWYLSLPNLNFLISDF